MLVCSGWPTFRDGMSQWMGRKERNKKKCDRFSRVLPDKTRICWSFDFVNVKGVKFDSYLRWSIFFIFWKNFSQGGKEKVG